MRFTMNSRFLRYIAGFCILILTAFVSGCSMEDYSVPFLGQDTRQGTALSIENIPEYDGEPVVVLEGNQPDFDREESAGEAFEEYAQLDELGRCGAACADLGEELMPTQERGAIGMIKPSGWHTVKYDCVQGKYLYNRCHLIGYQLAGENANEKNLITGTRYMNTEGMLPYENKVAEYIRETGNHVLYRVTPVFEGDNLLASGVQMEAWSVEDDGEGICFNVFAYNVQPGVTIDYATGESSLTSESPEAEEEKDEKDEIQNYIINKNTKKYHLPECDSVRDTKPQNRKSFSGRKSELEELGYEACQRCHP